MLDFLYTGTYDANLSRITSLQWNGSVVSTYDYLGLGMIVKETYPAPGPSVYLDYLYVPGNVYGALDRFNRVRVQPWRNSALDFVDAYSYGYNRNSSRTYRNNGVAYLQTPPKNFDENYTYDAVQRLTAANRGQLFVPRIVDPNLSQTWQLDSTGNWRQFASYDQTAAANSLVQQRTHNAANEITNISETVGPVWVTPTHDRNGNMTTIPQGSDPTAGYDCTWDAWNRLIEVKDGEITVTRHTYDGLNRRTLQYTPGTPDAYQHYYYNAAWQLLETRQATTAAVPDDPQYQWVWSLRYIDAPVLRDNRADDPETVYYVSARQTAC